MLTKSEKILRSLNNKQKSPCQIATTELYPKEAKLKQTARKWRNSVWVWWLSRPVTRLGRQGDEELSERGKKFLNYVQEL